MLAELKKFEEDKIKQIAVEEKEIKVKKNAESGLIGGLGLKI